ncbi:hypothetical protein KFE98_02790 [bacterium SCSIO 12741]|nr:hypothetical protein KFE98_02790 [bacterium SCSIO 12741]
MKTIKKLVIATSLMGMGLLFTNGAQAQKACCASKSSKSEKAESTSGCNPSNCRGAQTKFGEAKVITSLRDDLIALKAEMEKSTDPKFDERSYTIHDIVGESDDESLKIIAREVQVVEKELSSKMKVKVDAFEMPEEKAQQVQYLKGRIEVLKKNFS